MRTQIQNASSVSRLRREVGLMPLCAETFLKSRCGSVFAVHNTEIIGKSEFILCLSINVISRCLATPPHVLGTELRRPTAVIDGMLRIKFDGFLVSWLNRCASVSRAGLRSPDSAHSDHHRNGMDPTCTRHITAIHVTKTEWRHPVCGYCGGNPV
jgi:hypothetical protein